MDTVRELIRRWRADGEFRTMAGAAGSFFATLFFALYNGFLGIAAASVWHGAICAYYLVLTVLRGSILAAERKLSCAADREKGRRRVYLRASLWLLALNVSLLVPVTLMTTQQKPVRLTLIPAISMAAYTTVKVTLAAVNLKRRKRMRNRLAKLLRSISFIDALVSVLTLQNTLIMVSAKGDAKAMLPLAAATSGAVMLAVLLLSAVALAKGIRGAGAGRDIADAPVRPPSEEP